MRYLGEALNRRFGFSVVGPRLPGHGTSPDDMETTGYLDWMGVAEQALREVAKRKSKVFVTGLSMGGTLTVNLAARCPDFAFDPDAQNRRAVRSVIDTRDALQACSLALTCTNWLVSFFASDRIAASNQ